MPLVIQVLGAVQVTWNEVPLKFATEHARALLAFLAIESDKTHKRTTLATLLWPEEDEATARHNLRQALFFLRQTLSVVAERDAILDVTSSTIRWHSRDVACDLHRFQQLWRLGQANNLESFEEAVQLYQGELLQGLLLKHSQPFEEWALMLREQSHRQAITMLGALAAHFNTAGDFAQVQHYAARQVALEPWHEAAHRQLMLALAAQGLQNAALRQYEICRHLLQQELGVPPSAETTQLYEQLRAGMLPLAVAFFLIAAMNCFSSGPTGRLACRPLTDAVNAAP